MENHGETRVPLRQKSTLWIKQKWNIQIFGPLLVESLVIVIFYVIFLMCYAVIINYFGVFQLRENRG